MIAWSPRATAWLLQAIAGPDTVLVKQVSEPRNWFDTVSGVASILISISLLALCVGLIPAAWNFRKSYAKVNDLLDKVYGDINPIMRHASTIADNVNYVTTAVRVDVQQVNQTIATANQRLQDAVRLTEQRLHEFNALMAVVQEEAEGAFVSAASTVRGVSEGAASFRDQVASPSRREAIDRETLEALAEMEELEDEAELETTDVVLFAELDDPEHREERDGIVTDAPGGERPRVRPRRSTRGPA
jgi:uncharacterized protein YoxC